MELRSTKLVDFFFVTIHPGFQEPLFLSQVMLCERIKNNKNSPQKNKKDLTIRSALSQIFSSTRNVSKTWRRELKLTLENIFTENKTLEENKKKILKEFSEAIQDSLKNHNERKLIKENDRIMKGKMSNLLSSSNRQIEVTDADIDALGLIIKNTGGSITLDMLIEVVVRRKRSAE